MSQRGTKTTHLQRKPETGSANERDGKHKNFVDKLYSLDVYISRKMSFCAGKDDNWRNIFIALEISGHGIPWITGVLVAIFKLRDHPQQFAINLLLALILDLVIVGLIKVIVRRKRPVYNEMDMFLTVSVDNYSFPSGHSTRAAMMAALFCLVTTNILHRSFFLIWATSVAVSRVILGRHHVSDVLFGYLIGLMQYWLIIQIWLPLDMCHYLITSIPYIDIAN